MPIYARTMDQKLRVAVFRLKKTKQNKTKSKATALDTFCPYLSKRLPFFACLSHKLLQTLNGTNLDYSTAILKEKLEETLDFGSQRGLPHSTEMSRNAHNNKNGKYGKISPTTTWRPMQMRRQGGPLVKPANLANLAKMANWSKSPTTTLRPM